MDDGKQQAKRHQALRLEGLRKRLAAAEASLDEAPPEAQRLARAVTGKLDPEIDCEEARAWLPSYVDAEAGGLDAAGLYPQVFRHLTLCPDCEAAYVEMVELALLQDAGTLPPVAEIPQPDLWFLPAPTLEEFVRSLAEEVVAVVSPAILPDVKALCQPFFQGIKEGREPYTAGNDAGAAASEALCLLAATYAAGRAITLELSAREIERQARSGRLEDTLRGRGEQAAREVGLIPATAQDFAATFARLAARDYQVWQALAQHR